MNLSKLSALFFGAPAKTAGKRSVKFQTLVKRERVEPSAGIGCDAWRFANNSARVMYVTVSVDFIKAGKK